MIGAGLSRDDQRTNPGAGLTQAETLAYLAVCRRKAVETLAAETLESLQGPSGFSKLRFSRGELHLYNIRHVQHHTGQVKSAFDQRNLLETIAQLL